MRVSTPQFYYQNSLQMSNKQTDVNDQVSYISSGKRVLTAKDDAVAFGTLSGYKNSLSSIEQYQRNVTRAEQHHSLIDTSLANAESVMFELKDYMLNANNGVRSEADLKSISEQVYQSLQQLFDIANSQDEAGDYIFSGYKTDISPFTQQENNVVSYRGDQGHRELAIANNINIDINQNGDEVFQKVENKLGDFSPTYQNNTSGFYVEKAIVADRSAYDSNATGASFTLNFISETDITVTDGNGNVTNISGYTPGQTIAFNGVEVIVEGNPLPGDEVKLNFQQNISVFDTIKSAIDWIDTKVAGGSDPQVQVDFDHILEQLQTSMNHLTARRAESGIKLQVIERQRNHHLDSELYLAEGRADIEDLDFAKAVSAFEESKIALQASQQTFVQVQNLSLFNFI